MSDATRHEQFRKEVAFIRGLDYLARRERVAGGCRVSTRSRQQRDSAERQQETIESAVRSRGALVDVWIEQRGVAGDSEEWFDYLAKVFPEIAERGIETVVFSELSRLVRPPDYGNANTGARPTPEQLRRIKRLAERHGITIVCVLPPDSGFSEERSWQTRRNGRCGRTKGTKSRKAGWCKEQRERWRRFARELAQDRCSYRDIAMIVNEEMRADGSYVRDISYETVRKWVKQAQGRA
jgi:hypothetical protein